MNDKVPGVPPLQLLDLLCGEGDEPVGEHAEPEEDGSGGDEPGQYQAHENGGQQRKLDHSSETTDCVTKCSLEILNM